MRPQGIEDGLSVARVDRCRVDAVMDKPEIIVLEGRDGQD
jgi:hypothetical protein